MLCRDIYDSRKIVEPIVEVPETKWTLSGTLRKEIRANPEIAEIWEG
jgi:hypothetical protein